MNPVLSTTFGKCLDPFDADVNRRFFFQSRSSDASETEDQVLDGVEASGERVFQDGPVRRGHQHIQPGHQRAGEVQ